MSENNTFENLLATTSEIGYVQSSSFPLVNVKGLPNVTPGEVVLFESGQFGQVRALKNDLVNILVFSKRALTIGLRTVRTGQTMSVGVGDQILGVSLNPLGGSLYRSKLISESSLKYPVEAQARGISERVEISDPLITGVSLVDMLVPLGRGQRELVIGDRQTGKTSFGLQTVLNQALSGVVCVYGCIGKKKADIEYVENFITKNNIRDKTIIVASGASDSLANIYLTPYTTMSVAEYFRDQGKHVLVVLDDMTTHAKYYREISLLSGKFPGRDSYPGDIFYTHSRIVERAGNFKEGSITLLPIVNTVEGDISGYIQTNLMSMTDGHIYFDKDLFYSGQRPAVDIHVSVTRVGRQTQSKLRWSINRELTSFFVLYQKTENFVHFGAELSEGIKNTLETGKRLLQFFTQQPDIIMGTNLQIFLFVVLWSGLWNSKSVDEVAMTVTNVQHLYVSDQNFSSVVDNLIDQKEDLNSLLGKFMKEVKSFEGYIK